jgi:hypothetical protein
LGHLPQSFLEVVPLLGGSAQVAKHQKESGPFSVRTGDNRQGALEELAVPEWKDHFFHGLPARVPILAKSLQVKTEPVAWEDA